MRKLSAAAVALTLALAACTNQKPLTTYDKSEIVSRQNTLETYHATMRQTGVIDPGTTVESEVFYQAPDRYTQIVTSPKIFSGYTISSQGSQIFFSDPRFGRTVIHRGLPTVEHAIDRLNAKFDDEQKYFPASLGARTAVAGQDAREINSQSKSAYVTEKKEAIDSLRALPLAASMKIVGTPYSYSFTKVTYNTPGESPALPIMTNTPPTIIDFDAQPIDPKTVEGIATKAKFKLVVPAKIPDGLKLKTTIATPSGVAMLYDGGLHYIAVEESRVGQNVAYDFGVRVLVGGRIGRLIPGPFTQFFEIVNGQTQFNLTTNLPTDDLLSTAAALVSTSTAPEAHQ